MYVLQNVSPFGDLLVALVFRQHGVIAAGAEFEVSEEQAAQLLLQPANFAPAEGPAGEAARALLARIEADEAAALLPAVDPAGDAPADPPTGDAPAGRSRAQRNAAGAIPEGATK